MVINVKMVSVNVAKAMDVVETRNIATKIQNAVCISYEKFRQTKYDLFLIHHVSYHTFSFKIVSSVDDDNPVLTEGNKT